MTSESLLWILIKVFPPCKSSDLLQQKLKTTEFEVEALSVSKGIWSTFGFGPISLYSLGSRLNLEYYN